MGFSITDLADESRNIFVNFWNWHPTVEIIRTAGLLDEKRLAGLHQQMSVTRVSLDEARAIGQHLRQHVLPTLPTDSRVLLDGTVTNEPDEGEFHHTTEHSSENYSATRSWIETFADFCESCSGFEFN